MVIQLNWWHIKIQTEKLKKGNEMNEWVNLFESAINDLIILYNWSEYGFCIPITIWRF